jgi:hypothetical protein
MKKVLIVAPILTRSGYGEHARFVVDALSKYPDKFDLYIHPLTWGNSSWEAGNNEKRKYYDELIRKTALFKGQFDLSVQVTIPPEWQKIAPINVGVTAGVETDRCPNSWMEKINLMDKVIVTSKHIKKIFEETEFEVQNQFSKEKVLFKGCNPPVEVVSYPIKDITPSDISSKLNLSTDFNFLTVAQVAPRKNLFATIEWFIEEFRNEDVGLVVKSHLVNNALSDRYRVAHILKNLLSQTGDRKCKVYHIHGNMTDEDLHGLYINDKIKCMVSTTHGEGFGLPLFESAYRGLPVICPSWSGQVDFLYAPKVKKTGKKEFRAHFEKVKYDIKPIAKDAVMENALEEGMSWCYPQKESFKKSLRGVYRDWESKKKTAENLQSYVLDKFSETNQHDHMVKAIVGSYEETANWNSHINEVNVF